MIYRASAYSSYVLHERAQHYYGEGIGLLSIKSFYGGQALYKLGRGQYVADETSYLILNHGQGYAITIESDTPVESFCIFFAAGFANEVRRSLVTPMNRLLAEPHRQETSAITFFERTYLHDHILSPTLFQLRQALAQQRHEAGWLTEQLHQLMQRLLQVHYNVYKEMEALPAVRSSTREELYRRLYLVKEYAAAAFDQPITLDDMAEVAALSPNHLLRAFKQLFQQTPYQFLIAQRLKRAQKLLIHTDRSVTDICFSVGFESLGAFSWLFRRRVGLSPIEYRRQNR